MTFHPADPGVYLRGCRLADELSLRAVADACGVSPHRLGTYERGVEPIPDRLIGRLADAVPSFETHAFLALTGRSVRRNPPPILSAEDLEAALEFGRRDFPWVAVFAHHVPPALPLHMPEGRSVWAFPEEGVVRYGPTPVQERDPVIAHLAISTALAEMSRARARAEEIARGLEGIPALLGGLVRPSYGVIRLCEFHRPDRSWTAWSRDGIVRWLKGALWPSDSMRKWRGNVRVTVEIDYPVEVEAPDLDAAEMALRHIYGENELAVEPTTFAVGRHGRCRGATPKFERTSYRCVLTPLDSDTPDGSEA